MSSFWNAYIFILTGVFFAGLIALIHFTRRMPDPGNDDGEGPKETTGHEFDGIEELNNPMPRWWLNLFWLTIVFSLGYLVLFPVGNWDGLLGWSSTGQLTEEQVAHQRRYGEIYDRLASIPVEQLHQDDQAMRVGRRLYEDNCALCHGQAATGSYGFPDLTDGAWLYGGSGEAVKTSIMAGRSGQMPAWGDALGDQGVRALTEYVLQLSGQEGVNTNLASRGESLYQSNCVACHAADGTGNTALGAPDLTDDVWLYRIPGETLRTSVSYTLENGRSGNMPAWENVLGEQRAHILAGYVYGLSQ